jgi:hypothetical protein
MKKPGRSNKRAARNGYRRTSANESEGALIAKRVANVGTLPKGKAAEHHKRETNAQRAAREDERRTFELIAGTLATTICKKGRPPYRTDAIIHRIKQLKGKMLVAMYPKPRSKSTLRFTLLHAPPDVVHLPVKKPESERLRETYASVGREFCEFKGNVSEFLRLVADKIEGKPSYSPGEIWYDPAIQRAYLSACHFEHWDEAWAPVLPAPTFSEFKKVFREQNPKLQGASDRSLRRSLKRLGCYTLSDERGRPKKK